MEPNKNSHKQFDKRWWYAFAVIAASIAFYFLLDRLGEIINGVSVILGILRPVVFGFIIAYVLNPMMMFFEKHIKRLFEKLAKKPKKVGKKPKNTEKLSRGIAILLSEAIALSIVVAVFWLLIPELYTSISGLIMDLPSKIDSVTKWFNGLVENNSQLQSVVNTASSMIKNWTQTDLAAMLNKWAPIAVNGLIDFVGVVYGLIIGVIISVYILSGKETFSRTIKRIMYAGFKKSETVDVIIDTARHSHSIFSGYITGQLTDAAIVGVLCFIGLSILRIPYPLLVSVVVGVTNVIPFFGPYIGGIPSALLIFIVDPLKGLYFVLFILVLQQFDGNVICPKILGQSTGISSFWVVFAILLGGGLFGFAGMLIGVPTFAVIYYIVKRVVGYRLRKKNIRTDGAGDMIHETEE